MGSGGRHNSIVINVMGVVHGLRTLSQQKKCTTLTRPENGVGDLPLVYLVQRDDEADASGPVTRGSFPPRR